MSDADGIAREIGRECARLILKGSLEGEALRALERLEALAKLVDENLARELANVVRRGIE